MTNKQSTQFAISSVGDSFFEVFDTYTKETVFVSDSEAKAKHAQYLLNTAKEVPKRMEEVK